MSLVTLPPPETVRRLLIWHQGALGDLLLAGPGLAAIRRHYPQARITALGHPERWRLLAKNLHLEAIWDSSAALWSDLFSTAGLAPELVRRLAPFELALIFSPRPQPHLEARLILAGIPAVAWIPAFPADNHGRMPVAILQAQHCARLGLRVSGHPWRLASDQGDAEAATEPTGEGPCLAVAPGSGHASKNWPLSHYYEVTRTLAWEYHFQVIWLAGPAEQAMLPYLQALAAAQGQMVLAQQPLARVAAILGQCQLYLGNDSGLTHLAAAAGTRRVLALFGPTDPEIWAPPGEQVRVLSGSCPQAPCSRGREIACSQPRCLNDLTPEAVLAVVAEMMQGT
jgi:ADP-heptose:LPS heptosyltransferase